MIGIYKITNKLTGKSYIGQSIHCGKRFDEHYKGNSQFIDQMIEFDGIENYTFEIVKTVEKEELNYWEDYYILLYNTMYPNGYNKRWNTSEEIRKTMKVEPLQSSQLLFNNNIEQELELENEECNNITLTDEELLQLKKWINLRKQLENNRIIFWYDEDEYNLEQLKRENPDKIFIHYWYEDDVYNMPSNIQEFKERKQEMIIKENSLIRPTKYCYKNQDYYNMLNKLTEAQKRKCKSLIFQLQNFNETKNVYSLNQYGKIEAESFGGDFIINEQYNKLALNLYDMNANLKYSWIEMFESGLIPRNNIKIIDLCGCFIDINDIKKKKRVVRQVLFE